MLPPCIFLCKTTALFFTPYDFSSLESFYYLCQVAVAVLGFQNGITNPEIGVHWCALTAWSIAAVLLHF